ncbi:hypothetical protein V7S43_000080 [Phytophthora oleae]|uniref:ABC transmembrane type-1 domain-containing protein n=1 Tax=Phytophthora oleae TaxID=2107226 RepID=A0ABD3GAG4_9STRA
MCFPAAILFVPLFLMTIKRKGEKFIGTIEKPLKLKVYLILAQVQLSFVYLTFGVIFERYTHSLLQKFGLLLFVPVMKLALKHYIARFASDSMESIPAVVVFSVDVFNGLYSSICIQTSSSWWILLIMVALNGLHTTLSMLEIKRATTSVLALNWKFDSNLQSNQRRVAVAPIRSNRAPSRRDIENFKSFSKLPLSKVPGTSNQGEISSKLLFRLEYCVLVGYIEAVIPLLYVLHLTIVSQLPSGKFYPHTRSLTGEQLQATVRNILAYALTEIGCLVWLHVEIKRKLGFSLLYQLAFVLETEIELLQGRLFVWIVILLQLTLAHYGSFLTQL